MYYFVMISWAFGLSPAFGHKVFFLSPLCRGDGSSGKKQKYQLQCSLTSTVVLFEEMWQRNLNTVVVVSKWGQVVVRSLLFRAP